MAARYDSGGMKKAILPVGCVGLVRRMRAKDNLPKRKKVTPQS
jgi:hypothetical protein